MTRLDRYKEIDLRAALPGFTYERRDHIAFITINRPERGNSLAPVMHAVARAIWREVREENDIRVAVVSAAGERHFCTGFDVSEAEGEDAEDAFVDKPLHESVFWSPYQNRVQKPVICAVNGLCVGGGLHFVVDSDIVVASRTAAFMDTHVNVGMVGAIENIGLAKRLPLGTALRMTLMGKAFRLPAERAHQLGLVDELADSPTAARALAEDMARTLLKNSPQAMALSKQAIWGSLEKGYDEALEDGWTLLRKHWQHPDFIEGPRAFAEKREPSWNPDPEAKIEKDEP
jgi:enoyl-CoA hydratase/carnithine racemase